MDIATVIFNGLALIGGVSGIQTLFKWIKNKNAKIKVLSSNAEYYIYQDELIVHTKIQLTNEKENPIYLTDVVGLLKQDPSKTKSKKGSVFSMRPTNPIFSPTKIEAKSTIELDFEINFSSIDLHSINRVGLLNLLGFLENDVPILVAKENDFDDKWDSLPLEMKLIFHVNGKEVVDSIVGVFSQGTIDNLYGTLNYVQIEKLKRDYLFGKKIRD